VSSRNDVWFSKLSNSEKSLVVIVSQGYIGDIKQRRQEFVRNGMDNISISGRPDLLRTPILNKATSELGKLDEISQRNPLLLNR